MGARWNPSPGHDTPAPYTAVLVVEVDDQPEWPPSHRLCRYEGVLKGGLSARGNHGAELEGGEVLDVELVILRGTKQKPGQKGFDMQCWTLRRQRLFSCWGREGRVCFLYLGVTERGVQRLNNEVLRSLVGEAEQELDDVVGWEVWTEMWGSHFSLENYPQV